MGTTYHNRVGYSVSSADKEYRESAVIYSKSDHEYKAEVEV
jgi:hypothetical protein